MAPALSEGGKGNSAGQPEVAAVALARLEERTRAAGTDWALGVLARSRALTSEGESDYREPIARLLYGEWLRREHRRVDAREQLRAAHEMFSRAGAGGFTERARRRVARHRRDRAPAGESRRATH